MIRRWSCLALLCWIQPGFAEEDPYLWLETIDDDTVNAWVDERNQATFEAYTETESFEKLEKRLLDTYDASDRIPFG